MLLNLYGAVVLIKLDLSPFQYLINKRLYSGFLDLKRNPSPTFFFFSFYTLSKKFNIPPLSAKYASPQIRYILKMKEFKRYLLFPN